MKTTNSFFSNLLLLCFALSLTVFMATGCDSGDDDDLPPLSNVQGTGGQGGGQSGDSGSAGAAGIGGADGGAGNGAAGGGVAGAAGQSGAAGNGGQGGSQPVPQDRVLQLVTNQGSRITLTFTPDDRWIFRITMTEPQAVFESSGTCSQPTQGFGVKECDIFNSNHPSLLVGGKVRFFELPSLGVAFGQTQPGVPFSGPESFSSETIFWFSSQDCNGLNGDLTTLSRKNATPFGVTRLNTDLGTFLHADFKLSLQGNSFSSVYSTTVGGGAGNENVTAASCSNGVATYVYTDANFPTLSNTLLTINTPSGLVATNREFVAVPTAKTATLGDIANRTFLGHYTSSESFTVPLRITFGPKVGNTVSATSIVHAAHVEFPIVNMQLIAASDPAAGARFIGPVASVNPLSFVYKKAAEVPGLFYTTDRDGSGAEKPNLVVVGKSATGKLVMSVTITGRSSVGVIPDSKIFAVEE